MNYGWLVGIALLLVGPGFAGSVEAAQSDFRLTLIGSGNPVPEADRFGPATLVEAGDQKLLFDAGRGATIRLWQLKIPFSKVSPLFLTHFHSDHTVGIPDLWLTGWLETPFAQRKGTFQVFGPTGTRNMMNNLEKAYEWDIRTRIADQKLAHTPAGEKVAALLDGMTLEKASTIPDEIRGWDKIRPSMWRAREDSNH